MFKQVCTAILISSLSSPVWAAKPCAVLDKAKFKPGTTFTMLTKGQLHFMQGAYSVVPPIGPPPGDSAILIQHGEKGAAVAFMSGKLACQVILIEPSFTKILLKVGTGPLDSAGEEL